MNWSRHPFPWQTGCSSIDHFKNCWAMDSHFDYANAHATVSLLTRNYNYMLQDL